MCINCGKPFYIPCNCPPAPETGCDPCSQQPVCNEKMNAECIIYNFNSEEASALLNLALPNGTNLKDIIEAVDASLNIATSSGSVSGYSAAVTALDDEDITTIAGLITAIATRLAQNEQNVVTTNQSITTLNNLNLNIGPVITGDTIKTAIQHIAQAIVTIQTRTAVSTDTGNQLEQKTNGLFVPVLQVSEDTGNMLQIRDDGIYVATTINGMTNQVLMETFVNTLLAAPADSTLRIKFGQLLDLYN